MSGRPGAGDRFFLPTGQAAEGAAARGEPLGGEEALTKHVLQEETRKIQIRLVEGLPTSFLTSRGWLGSVEYVICLQRELSPEQRALVLRHELEHIRLGHLWFKGWANMGYFSIGGTR